MNSQLSPFRDLGLQHLLESGLTLCEQPAALAAERRVEVMSGLAQVFSEADRGADPFRNPAGLWEKGDAPDFERFSIFFRYLDGAGDPVAELTQAKTAIEAIRNGRALDQMTVARLKRVIELLLAGLRRDHLSSPLIAPAEMKFS